MSGQLVEIFIACGSPPDPFSREPGLVGSINRFQNRKSSGMSIQIGPHVLRIEGDIIYSKSGGNFTKEHFEQYFAVAERLLEAHGTFYGIADISQLGNIGPEARRYAAHWAKSHTVGGAAILGARFSTRTIVLMITKVMEFFGGYKFPLAFVASEQEALTWLGSLRATNQASKR